MKKSFITIKCLLAITVCLVLTQSVYAGMQTITSSPAEISITPNATSSVNLIYNVTQGAKQTTGLGLRIHFNSKVISSLVLDEAYGEGLSGLDEVGVDDVNDLDNDVTTDKYIGVAWVGITGNWPTVLPMPLTLGKVIMKARPNITSTTTSINFTSSSVPANYQLKAEGVKITIP
jgi:hypothetical protein